ncbi:E3 ubiquitin-protein ligase ATL4 [Camellia lanceoleosa]|uniref:E3 ubiquitin-protein ligase ATL4 n=1 Tax=Camellia lanceoleosa TaxID=1840588 RepID=A0ACC0J436_9ERIC|nr:E3 ubiquitin-protein ligase ATL4 [Camellia lanceoleosa]
MPRVFACVDDVYSPPFLIVGGGVFACVDDICSPPFLIIGGGTTTFTIPQINHNDSSPPLSSSSPSSSLIIVIIIIASSIIVTASLYLLFYFITRHCNNHSFAAVDDVVSSRNNCDDSNRNRCLYEQRNSSNDLINSFPLFTLDFVTGNIVNSDCAVCLSKFERNDQLWLLPLCCYAFHTDCIDAWLLSNQTWLRDYVDGLASISSRTLSFCSSSRFFIGNSRRGNTVVTVDEELKANRIGEEISELFRWFSGSSAFLTSPNLDDSTPHSQIQGHHHPRYQ